MYQFADRQTNHDSGIDRAAARLAALLGPHGFVCERYGIEHRRKEFHDALLRCGADRTAHHLRYEPDLAFALTGASRAYLCEVKTLLPDTRTGNLSIELESLDELVRLEQAGYRVFVVFVWLGEVRACYPSAVRCTYTERDPVRLAEIRRRGRGSGTPYGLFPADSPWLRPLEHFLTEELGCPLRS